MGTGLDNQWRRFRSLSAGVQLVLWIFLFWLLIPLLIWRAPWSKGLKSGVTIAFAVVLIAAVASSEDPTSTEVANQERTDTQADEEQDDDEEVEVAADVSEDNVDAEEVEENKEQKPPGRLAFVARVIDGDTIEVDFGGRTLDVRLIGVDTPETVHPSEPVQCFGPAASNFTKRSLEGERVRLEFDVQRKDRYQRTLAYVWVGGELFNERLVAKGFAQVSTFPPNVKYEHRFIKVQRKARNQDKGLWGSCTEEKPADEESGGGAAPSDQEPGCTPGYSPCLPPASDYDCAGGSGDGPEYATGPIEVTGSDPYSLDSDGDGTACE